MATGTPLRTVVKMNGAGNEFLVLDERTPAFQNYGALARTWCARRHGIGADGLLVISSPTAGGAATMQVFNADGSEAEACGNGLRCTARYLWERGAGDAFQVETPAGTVGIEIAACDGGVTVRADIGVPHIVRPFRDRASLDALGRTWHYGYAEVPNPHVVIVLEDLVTVDLLRLGDAISRDARFPAGTNVHVARIDGRGAIGMRHFERGVGLTQACGTGAIAASVLLIDDGRVQSPVRVAVPGGALSVEWSLGGHAYLSGPAEVEFERTVEAT